MDVLALSRLQFAATCFFHYIFVPLTLGLSVLIAIMETIYVKTGDEQYKAMAKFWGKVFLINFAVGVVTGMPLEFQFGTNWSGYSKYVGDVFGSLLAIEALASFFLESVFIGVWHFSWNKLSKKAHCICIWLVAFASNLSAVWILIANAWMQRPIGYHIVNGRAELTDFFAVITQKFAILTIVHTLGGAYVLAGFFVLGISAYYILKQQHVDFFKKSLRVALIFAFVFSIFEILQGHMNGAIVAYKQPSKFAAMESLWETGKNVPAYLLIAPNEKNEKNSLQTGEIKNILSLLAFHDPNATIKGLKEYPKELRPPVAITFWSFRIMVGLGFLFVLLTALGLFFYKNIETHTTFLRILMYTIPLPYIANQLGWAVAEVGRQPWIVYGLMKTSDAVSKIAVSDVWISLGGFVFIYSILAFVDFYLIARHIKKGPNPIFEELNIQGVK